MKLTNENITELEKVAELNDGHCDRCGQTIKIYRYRLNKTHTRFMRAMADEARNIGVNDIDVGTLGLAYSVRTQNTKLRLHGLIARVKNGEGKQIPRRWLITHKGYDFLTGKDVPAKVVVFNNQVLGHDNEVTNIYRIMGERFDPEAPTYSETPVSQPEARTYQDVRTPQKNLVIQAIFKGRDINGRFKVSRTYELTIKRMEMGKPIEVVAVDGEPVEHSYKDIAAFQKNWKSL